MADIMKRAAVLGASGYTGAEAVRLIVGHPRLKLAALTGHSRAGEAYGDIYPSMSHLNLPDVVRADEVDWDSIDVVFACLPHGASQDTIATIADRVETIIDLSADFRLRDAELYARTYGRSHDHPALLENAVYGLTASQGQGVRRHWPSLIAKLRMGPMPMEWARTVTPLKLTRYLPVTAQARWP